MSLISCFYFYFIYKFDLSKNKIFSIAAFLPIFLLGFSFDLIALGYLDHMMVYDQFEVNLYLFIIINIILISGVSAIFFTNKFLKLKNSSITRNKINDLRSLHVVYRVLCILVFIAFLVNFQRVGFSLELLIYSPREYELSFGKYTAINYIYFLNVLAVFLYVYLNYFKVIKKLDFLFFMTVIVTSVFFGNKSAFLDVFFVIIFTYLLMEGVTKKIYLSIVALIPIVFVFFEFVRGGGIDGIFGYLVQGYVNFYYKIVSMDFVYQSFFVFISNGFSLIPVENEILVAKIEKGFILNDKYNTFTSFYEPYGVFSFFGWFIFFVFTYFVINYFSHKHSILQFISVLFAWVLFLSFFSYRFGAFKYQYLIFVVVILYFILNRLKFKKKVK
ncbi:hypothetical protein A28LD_1621 [Idiomarina sp. A28L]|uniref:O-antigen polymerase n=1 Tax=Idiomarina sp. A28L TaxID=1036674 RepID=UPI0002138C4B|nr:O-antigen polymerase [Idiomarina sp. A28L]EGN74608.1 hypothetical protein A28LD_1621 [Idiomarina sp. A28L]